MPEHNSHRYVNGGPHENSGFQYREEPSVIHVSQQPAEYVPDITSIISVMESEGVDPSFYKSAVFLVVDQPYLKQLEKIMAIPMFAHSTGAYMRETYLQRRGDTTTAMSPVVMLDLVTKRSYRYKNQTVLHELGHLVRDAFNQSIDVEYNDENYVQNIEKNAQSAFVESVATFIPALTIEAAYNVPFPTFTTLSILAGMVAAVGMKYPEYYAWLRQKEERMANRFARKHKAVNVLRKIDWM